MVRKRSWPAVSHWIRYELRFADVSFYRLPQYSSFSACGDSYEINADSIIEGGSEVVLDVAHEHAGFTHSWVANYQDFEQLRIAASCELYLSVLLYCISIINLIVWISN